MKAKLAALTLAPLLLLLGGAAFAQDTAPREVSLWIFEARVRSFAPGIEAVIALTEEQKKQLGDAYVEVFQTNAVALANMVLQDDRTSFAQRQLATATIEQAWADFRAKSRAVFTEEQRELIDKVYAAFARVQEAAQQEMVQKVTAEFGKALDELLTPEQKQAMEQARAEIEEAERKAADEKDEGAPPEETDG